MTPGGQVANPTLVDSLSTYAWFLTFGLSFVLYLLVAGGFRMASAAAVAALVIAGSGAAVSAQVDTGKWPAVAPLHATINGLQSDKYARIDVTVYATSGRALYQVVCLPGNNVEAHGPGNPYQEYNLSADLDCSLVVVRRTKDDPPTLFIERLNRDEHWASRGRFHARKSSARAAIILNTAESGIFA